MTVNGLVMALPTSGDATTLKLNVPADSAAEVVITPLEDTAKLDASSPVSEYVSVPLPPRLAEDVTIAAPLLDTLFVTLAMLVAGDASHVGVIRPIDPGLHVAGAGHIRRWRQRTVGDGRILTCVTTPEEV